MERATNAALRFEAQSRKVSSQSRKAWQLELPRLCHGTLTHNCEQQGEKEDGA